MNDPRIGNTDDSAPIHHKPPTGGASGAVAPSPSRGGSGATPSNTAPHSCRPVERILRWGVDSLYLSFPGKLHEETEAKLIRLKEKAQSPDPREKAQAQWVVGEHAFEVKDKGAGVFAFVLEDACFRISFSKRTANRLPMATVKLSSRYLSTVTPVQGMQKAISILTTMGQLDAAAGVSRIDLFVDFVSYEDMESWTRDAWVTRAERLHQYAEHTKFSGWSIGAGGPIMMRLYDKNLQIEKVGAQYLRTLWDAGGWKDGQPVWRLEFEYKRELLARMGLNSFETVMAQLNGLWSYAMTDWLRLCIPSLDDATRSRWPVHPLWAALSSVDFGSAEMSRLRRVVTTQKPSEESVIRRAIACLITFMVLRGFTEYLAAFREMSDAIDSTLEADAFYQGIAAQKLVEERIALKAREYFIPNGVGEVVPDDGDDPATAYRKASQGG
ncbi:MAG: replication initiation factor [Betaproteobacteria bacterium]|nr:replication initiation factor [Betaproteobacteria bacterium]